MANKPPVATLRDGNLKAAIWEHQHEEAMLYNVTFSRSYLDDEGNWQDSWSFGLRDLLGLGKLAVAAHSTIRELMSRQPQPAAEASDQEQAGPPHSGGGGSGGGGNGKSSQKLR